MRVFNSPPFGARLTAESAVMRQLLQTLLESRNEQILFAAEVPGLKPAVRKAEGRAIKEFRCSPLPSLGFGNRRKGLLGQFVVASAACAGAGLSP